jgi:thiamine biosynthesis lipoprotein
LIKKAVSIILLIFTTLVLPGCGEKELTKYQAEFIMLFDTVTRIVGYTETKEEFTGYSQIIRDDLK